MTANEMIPAVGMTVSVRFEEIQVICIVRDVKSAYGRARLQVEPIAGAGSQWVELARVRVATTPEGSTGENWKRLEVR